MSLKNLTDNLVNLKQELNKAILQIKLDDKVAKLAELDKIISDSNIWTNVERAQNLIKQANSLRSQLEPWQVLRAQVNDILDLIQELNDESLEAEFNSQVEALNCDYQRLKKDLLFKDKYDDHAAILKLSAGAGGTEAQDWAAMLERMYLRWAEKTGLTIELIDRSCGDEAGIKSALYSISGSYAYGKLRSEHGVHRLVRLSPFNADHLRQTSFALVEVLPVIDTPDEVKIDNKDLKIDVYHAGGHGGQSVNTTDSAVRVTHLPTGIVVAIQNERSQLQNKERAMQILRSKLKQMQLEQHTNSIDELRAKESAAWGAQIRNYVMHPYTLVKDTRSRYETKDVTGVLDGNLDGFIMAYLEWQVTEKPEN